jgi:hypothetical protein
MKRSYVYLLGGDIDSATTDIQEAERVDARLATSIPEHAEIAKILSEQKIRMYKTSEPKPFRSSLLADFRAEECNKGVANICIPDMVANFLQTFLDSSNAALCSFLIDYI